jgi:betaine-homocysteine S-methyltransferase
MGMLSQRLAEGPVLCAEGYLFELERRGYLQAGAFVPEVVLDYPEVVSQLHRDFLRAGSDVMVAFTYYAHREKMRLVGKEDLIEPLQKNALALAKAVAAEDKSGRTLFAGDLSNTNIYFPEDRASHVEVRKMFDEQLAWAAEAGVDFVLIETISWHGEAMIGLEAAQAFGLDAVVNVVSHSTGLLRENMTPAESCKRLADAGAAVVGMNCCRGPATMFPQLLEIREAVSVPVAGIPVTYRTDEAHPSFQSLVDTHPQCCVPEGERPFPVGLDSFVCSRYEMADFARRCVENDITFIGVCCGGAPHHLRAMAEALGRSPEASRFSADMSKHYALGTDSSLIKENQKFSDRI